MAGFGNLYSGMDDDGFDYEKDWDPNTVFANFGKTEASEPRAARPAISRTSGGVVVETRPKRKVTLPY